MQMEDKRTFGYWSPRSRLGVDYCPHCNAQLIQDTSQPQYPHDAIYLICPNACTINYNKLRQQGEAKMEERHWEKTNLVTLPDGSDLFKCSLCGFKKKYYGLYRDINCPKCKGGKKHGTPFIINGCWTAQQNLGKSRCNFCCAFFIECPKDNHPNARFWSLQRTGDEILVVCPNGCAEDGSFIGTTKTKGEAKMAKKSVVKNTVKELVKKFKTAGKLVITRAERTCDICGKKIAAGAVYLKLNRKSAHPSCVPGRIKEAKEFEKNQPAKTKSAPKKKTPPAKKTAPVTDKAAEKKAEPPVEPAPKFKDDTPDIPPQGFTNACYKMLCEIHECICMTKRMMGPVADLNCAGPIEEVAPETYRELPTDVTPRDDLADCVVCSYMLAQPGALVWTCPEHGTLEKAAMPGEVEADDNAEL